MELMQASPVYFKSATMSVGEIAWNVSLLHTVSLYDPDDPDGESSDSAKRTTDVAAALAWGRKHARHVAPPIPGHHRERD